jgi:hypothetical protein
MPRRKPITNLALFDTEEEYPDWTEPTPSRPSSIYFLSLRAAVPIRFLVRIRKPRGMGAGRFVRTDGFVLRLQSIARQFWFRNY